MAKKLTVKEKLQEQCVELGLAWEEEDTIKELKQRIDDYQLEQQRLAEIERKESEEKNNASNTPRVPQGKRIEAPVFIDKVDLPLMMKEKGISGINKKFLMSKYALRTYTREQWLMVFDKENIKY